MFLEGLLEVPEKITSSIPEPLMLFAEFSPMHHLKDSTMLDFPHPLGPTIPVKPSSIKKVVLSENDLKVTDEITINLFKEALLKTRKHLIKYFGRVDILLGDLQRHTRGEISLPVSGLIDMIAPTYVTKYKEGTYRSVSGESYIMLVKYSDSNIEIETVLPYGNSNDPLSPHYTDQMKLYIDKKTKPMTLDKQLIYKNAASVYNPN